MASRSTIFDQESNSSYLIPNPPSHILSNGKFVYLPKPTNREKAAFFQRAIVAHNLVSAEKNEKQDCDNDGDGDAPVDVTEGGSTSNSVSTAEDKIHPLAIAAARIETLGISELSKSINLGTLVGTDYFDMANIVSQEGIATLATISPANKSAEDNSKTGEKTSSIRGRDGCDYTKSDHTAKQLLNQRLRATYLLKRKHSQLVDAANFLELHKCRLECSLERQRLIDRRYLQLRKQWRLAAPEHGTRVMGPVRPNEVISVDVETYDRDRVGGGAGVSNVPCEARRRLARMVPRYATIELEHPSKNSKRIQPSAISCKSVLPTNTSKQSDIQPMDVDGGDLLNYIEIAKDGAMANQDSDHNGSNTSSTAESAKTTPTLEFIASLSQKLNLITKAEPYAVADPTLGKLDLEFDPEKVPMWTLLLSLTRNSTGFSVSSTLSPKAPFFESVNETNTYRKNEKASRVADLEEGPTMKTDIEHGTDDKTANTGTDVIRKDEVVIQALQHSLFCATIFDAIRHEVCTANTSTATASGCSNSGIGGSRPTVWISSETEELFFPPTLLLASGSGYDPSRGGRLGFCVSYCQEGEVAVQLDTEYLLIIKLIEVGTAAEASKIEPAFCGQSTGDGQVESHTDGNAYDVAERERGIGGSQSPDQLRALCRALLLHVQFQYHDFRRRTPTNIKAPLPTMPQRSKVGSWCARILEKCVGFGSKVLFEAKIIAVLQRISCWLKKNHPSESILVERLPLSFFDSHAHFAINIGGIYTADVHIIGGLMRLTTFFSLSPGHDDAEHPYQTASFASDKAFEHHLNLVVRKILLAK